MGEKDSSYDGKIMKKLLGDLYDLERIRTRITSLLGCFQLQVTEYPTVRYGLIQIFIISHNN